MRYHAPNPANSWTGRLLLCFLLIPSALYLWAYSDLPLFGDFHDDTLYYVSAKSLAEGHGYTIASLPGQPPQTKYPPLYPLLLSLVWRVQPQFPENLRLAGWLSWLAMPLLILWLLPKQWARWGLSENRIWILVALFANNPYVIWLSSGLLTELYFLALAIGAMLLVERSRKDGPKWALAGGLVAGIAYLTRSAGLPLLPAGLLYLWFRGQRDARNKALAYGAAMLPCILGWMVWTRLHLTKTADPSLTYYIDYFGYQLQNVSLEDYPLVLWKNIDGYLWGLGALVIPKVERGILIKILSQVVAIAMISGAVRMIRKGQAQLYGIFASISTVLLLIWHFPPDERFVMPLWPLAFAGLLTELDHLRSMLRAAREHPDRSQRVVAAGMFASVVAIFGAALAYQVFVDVKHLPTDAELHRIRRAEQVQAYHWIRDNVPQDGAFFAQLDPLLYLYTGRAATSRPLPPRQWYHDDFETMVGAWAHVGDFARSHKLGYYYAMSTDLQRMFDEEYLPKAAEALKSNTDLTPVYSTKEITVYKVLDPARAAVTPSDAAAQRTEARPTAR